MRSLRLSAAVSAVVSFALSISVCFAQATQHPGPAPTVRVAGAHFSADTPDLYRSATEVTPPSGADIVVIENQETMVFDADGKVVRTQYFIYRVLTKRGAEQWADVAAVWSPWSEERPTIRARVLTSDNAVHALDPQTITDVPANASDNRIFSDQRVLRAPLPAVAPGAVVEEEQVYKGLTPIFGAGQAERFYFSGSVPVQHTLLVLDAPATLPIHYEVRLMPDLKPRRTVSGNRVRLEFERGALESVDEVEPELPGDTPDFASVTFSTGASWQRVAEEYDKIVDKQIASANLKPLVDQVIAGKKTRGDKAAAILQYLDRNVRYTGVEFGAATIVPRPPDETLTRKYGDCKDKSALLVAMLRTAKIPAYVALLNVGSREDVSFDLPGMGMFDHAIVYVPGTPDLWIDATDEYARLGQVPPADQGRLSLIARPETVALVHTPVSTSTDNTVTEKREIFLSENGPARIVETSLPHGGAESWYRRMYADKENKKAKEDLTRYVKSQYLAEKLDRMDRSDPQDLSKPFELILECDRARRGATDLDSAAAAIRFDTLFSRLPLDLRQRERAADDSKDKGQEQKPKKPRSADYQLPNAFVTEWLYTIVPPPGFVPKPLPEDANLSLGPAHLTETFSAGKDGVVHARIAFEVPKRRLTVVEAHALRDKVVEIQDSQAILIYFEPVGQVLLREGRVREALKSYRNLIAVHPQEAIRHLQLAQALLAAGLGNAARAEAQEAVKLQPASALAQKTLALILEYDSVGRRFRHGSDYAGAEAAYRAAVELDPDDKTAVANLAVLYEYDSWGMRYGPGSRLKDAIAQYRKLTPEKLTEFGIQNNLAFALFYDKQFAEARKNAEALNPQPANLIVACEAALNGSQSALKEARMRTGDEQQFRKLAESAGDLLINLREYSLGADLEEAGASGNHASETAAYASLYRQTVPHEKLQLSDSPADLAVRLELLTSDPDLTTDKLRSISSRNGAQVFATFDVVDYYVEKEKAFLNRKARKGEFADVGLDISITRAQPRVRGNDKIGYKVTLFATAAYKTAVYVVKENGHYKVLGNSYAPAALGLEALDRIAANDLAGARALFDWLREDQHLAGGDDPLAGTAFPRFWTKGKTADAAMMKLTAASILIQSKETAAQGIAILEREKNSGSDSERLNVALALLSAYNSLDDFAKSLSVCESLARQYPESKMVFSVRTYDLSALGRFAEADRVAEGLLQRIPDDADGLRALIKIAEMSGNYPKAQPLGRKLLETDDADYWDLNSFAWNALFIGKVQPEDLETVLKASQLSGQNAYILHTLGCVYAEVGKTQEAREVLIQAMDTNELDEPDDNYWYAFGRIAEQYGEREVAIAMYQRVTKPKRAVEIPFSTYQLAQVRLEKLRNEKQK